MSWLPLPTKSYTPVLRHICLNASIPTFLLTPCSHRPPLTCTSLALIFISVHARFILQLQQSEILSLLLFVRLKPWTLFENILKPIFSSLHVIAPSDLSSTSDLFYGMIMALNQIYKLLTYLLICKYIPFNSMAWLGGVMVWAFSSWLKRRRFRPGPFRFQIRSLGKFFTHRQYKMVTVKGRWCPKVGLTLHLAMHHRLKWFV